ncbi:MAG: ComF family protein, partial [Anaerolineae bacterium]|nr:ComF family protein [Anaerolineae bacterium]
YNQAEKLAIKLGDFLDVPCNPHALRRIRNTSSQVGLNYVQRQENVAEAFIAQEEGLKDLRVLLIDDVYTTGATMDACARAAQAAGTRAVYALTVTAARA